MRSVFLPLFAILNWARMQIEALKARPELGTGIPRPLADLSAIVDKLDVAKKKQEAIKKALRLATDEVQQVLFELKTSLTGNRAMVAMRHGGHSPEFVLFGGKPRKSRRKVAGDAATAPETHSAPITGEAA